MLALAHRLRDLLLPFLELISVALLVVLVAILLGRVAGLAMDARRRRVESRYRPLVSAIVDPEPPASALAAFAGVPRRHQAIVGRLLLAPLAVTAGETVEAIRAACTRAGLDRHWREGLRARRWWTRADSARALGVIGDRESTAALREMLDDDHDEVRAAVIDALGAIGDPVALPALVSLLSTPSRHQRARVAEALRRFGERAVAPLLARGQAAPHDRLVIAELFGMVRAHGAMAALLDWAGGDLPALRAAAWRALGSIGLDDRTYYHALKALRDSSPEVRAAAARALGQARRDASAPYLAALLDDDWIVAANAASALKSVGAAGLVALERRASDDGQAGDLARQMVWERAAFAGVRP